MNVIAAHIGTSPHMGDIEHLSIYIDGIRLDEIISKENSSFLGLIPAWLDYYDNEFEPSKKEKEYVWKQTELSDFPVILPILLCSDDFDFSCTVIVVEVTCCNDKVIWNRFGIDITDFDSTSCDLPKYIGKSVKWMHDIEPFIFPKEIYLSCICKFIENKK